MLIGAEMDQESIRAQLERCLLTDEEMDADWDAFEDRFPTFEEPEERADDASETHDEQEEIGIAT